MIRNILVGHERIELLAEATGLQPATLSIRVMHTPK